MSERIQRIARPGAMAALILCLLVPLVWDRLFPAFEGDAVNVQLTMMRPDDEIEAPESSMRAVRTERWKYIRNYSDDAVGLDQCAHMAWAHRLCELPNQGWIRPRVPEELYDLESDPNEQRNLVSDPASETVLVSMRRRLDRQMAETRDPYLGREFERNFTAQDFEHQAGKPYP